MTEAMSTIFLEVSKYLVAQHAPGLTRLHHIRKSGFMEN
jgi:hypothetical protein